MSPCAWCGGELTPGWVDTSALGGLGFSTARGRDECSNPGCAPRCPTCRRQPGDIHGPHCGPIMVAKVGELEPCRITRADCGTRRMSAQLDAVISKPLP